jgi:hypothetical protein
VKEDLMDDKKEVLKRKAFPISESGVHNILEG